MLKRISITIPDEAYEALERILNKLGIKNRSRIVTDAILRYESEVLVPEENVAGAIIIYYDHGRGETTKEVIEVQHNYLGLIRAISHLHLRKNLCMEVLSIAGHWADIKNMVAQLRRISGVLTVRYALMPVEAEDHHCD